MEYGTWGCRPINDLIENSHKKEIVNLDVTQITYENVKES